MKPMMKLLYMKTVSKCLACMKGCRDPESEPSMVEIMDYQCDIHGNSLSLLSLASSYTWGISLFSLVY